MGEWVGGSAKIPGGQFEPPPPPVSLSKGLVPELPMDFVLLVAEVPKHWSLALDQVSEELSCASCGVEVQGSPRTRLIVVISETGHGAGTAILMPAQITGNKRVVGACLPHPSNSDWAPMVCRVVLKNPDYLLFCEGLPLMTAPRDHQPPTANCCQPSPTANRQPPTPTNRQPPSAANGQPPTFEVEKVPGP